LGAVRRFRDPGRPVRRGSWCKRLRRGLRVFSISPRPLARIAAGERHKGLRCFRLADRINGAKFERSRPGGPRPDRFRGLVAEPPTASNRPRRGMARKRERPTGRSAPRRATRGARAAAEQSAWARSPPSGPASPLQARQGSASAASKRRGRGTAASDGRQDVAYWRVFKRAADCAKSRQTDRVGLLDSGPARTARRRQCSGARPSGVVAAGLPVGRRGCSAGRSDPGPGAWWRCRPQLEKKRCIDASRVLDQVGDDSFDAAARRGGHHRNPRNYGRPCLRPARRPRWLRLVLWRAIGRASLSFGGAQSRSRRGSNRWPLIRRSFKPGALVDEIQGGRPYTSLPDTVPVAASSEAEHAALAQPNHVRASNLPRPGWRGGGLACGVAHGKTAPTDPERWRRTAEAARGRARAISKDWKRAAGGGKETERGGGCRRSRGGYGKGRKES